MANWGDMVEVVNRTSTPLNVKWDGKEHTLEPNYSADGTLLKDVRNLIPRHIVPYAKKQNILMGSENPIDVTDYESLVAVKDAGKKRKDDISYLEQSKELTRVNLREMLADDPSVKDIRVGRGKFRVNEAGVPGLAHGGIMAQEPL